MIHPDQEIDYQSKLEQAARSWLINNPSSKQTVKEVAAEIRENNLKVWVMVPCTEFDYSGTIWCDRCGFESSSHLAKHTQNQIQEEPKIKRGSFRTKQHFVSKIKT